MVTEPATPLGRQLHRFLDDAASSSFEELALAAFAFQYENIGPYRNLCDRRGATPATITDWRAVPMVPTSAFRTVTLAAAPAVTVFRSSGTTGGPESRGVHHHPFPDLYRHAIDASFPAFCLPGLPAAGSGPPMLSLIPSRADLPDSSLSFMADHLLARWGGPGSTVAFGARGLDFPALRSWCSARQRSGRAGMILTTALALAHTLERVERAGLRFRLPAGTSVFETGGFKGRSREISRRELLDRLGETLAIPAAQVVREYGMTELTSQCYSRALSGGDADLLVAPHWMRVRILDPETLAEAPPGSPGLIALFDLANLGSALHLLTEDLGAKEGDGFRLLGRAAGSQLRGCSLAAEELTEAG